VHACLPLSATLDLALKHGSQSSSTDPHQEPHKHMNKLFGPLRERYENRPGGYTRVLRIEPLKPDQAPSAILELVDGPRDIRFAMTAKALVKQREDGVGMNEITAVNVRKVTRFREGGEDDLEAEVLRLEREQTRVRREEEKGESEWVGYGSNVGKRKVEKKDI
jgi:large subunit ribosomal protein L17